MNGLELSTTGHTLEETCNLIIIQHQHCMSSRNHQKLEPSKSKKKFTKAQTILEKKQIDNSDDNGSVEQSTQTRRSCNTLPSPHISKDNTKTPKSNRNETMGIHYNQWTKQNKSHHHLCLPCLSDYY